MKAAIPGLVNYHGAQGERIAIYPIQKHPDDFTIATLRSTASFAIRDAFADGEIHLDPIAVDMHFAREDFKARVFAYQNAGSVYREAQAAYRHEGIDSFGVTGLIKTSDSLSRVKRYGRSLLSRMQATIEPIDAGFGELIENLTPRPNMYVNDLYTRPNAQRHGIGAALLYEASLSYDNRAVVVADVMPNVKAREFFEHRGFEPVSGVEPADALIADVAIPLTRMQMLNSDLQASLLDSHPWLAERDIPNTQTTTN